MSDPRNKIDCSKCHNEKCALAGKEFKMAVCTGYKPLTHYDEIHSMNVEQLAEWIDENSCNAMWCDPKALVEPDTGMCAIYDCKKCIVKWLESECEYGIGVDKMFEVVPNKESQEDFNVLDHIVTENITFGIKHKFLCFMEWLWGVRHKQCMFCKHFTPFHGSAGICERKKGCLNVDMRDCFDTCDRKAFKAVPPWGK